MYTGAKLIRTGAYGSRVFTHFESICIVLHLVS